MLCAACFQEIPDRSTLCECGESPFLAGRYALLELVGKGAMGATYRARDVDNDEVVALKELVFHRVDSFKTQELFDREAKVLGQLSHGAIPRFIDAFDTSLGASVYFYLVQEYIDGVNLHREMQSRRYTEADLREVVEEVAQILRYLHQFSSPVVHRDIKPSNIMRRSEDKRLMLIDFGMVKDAAKGEGGSTIAGTFGYMPPEQFRGEASPKSDIYGLGMTTIALAMGVDAAVFNDFSGGQRWQSRVQLSRPFISLLEAMTRAQPAQRPSAAEVLKRLAGLDQRPKLVGAGHSVRSVSRKPAGGVSSPPAPQLDSSARAAYFASDQVLVETERTAEHFEWARPATNEIVVTSNATDFARRKADLTDASTSSEPDGESGGRVLIVLFSIIILVLMMVIAVFLA